MASKIVMGSASHPPRAEGSDNLNNPASLTFAAKSAGIVRLASPSAARARNSGASSAARVRTSPRGPVGPPPPNLQHPLPPPDCCAASSRPDPPIEADPDSGFLGATHGILDGFDSFTQVLQAGANARHHSALQRLTGMGLAYVQFAAANPDLFRLLFRPELRDPRDKAGAATMAKAGMTAHQVFLDCVQAPIEEASVRSSVDDVAIAALRAVHGLATLLVDGPIDLSQRTGDQLARVVLHALGAGITVPEQPRRVHSGRKSP
jgi:Tetracyclin repressor-like, C-terminal domain